MKIHLIPPLGICVCNPMFGGLPGRLFDSGEPHCFKPGIAAIKINY